MLICQHTSLSPCSLNDERVTQYYGLMLVLSRGATCGHDLISDFGMPMLMMPRWTNFNLCGPKSSSMLSKQEMETFVADVNK